MPIEVGDDSMRYRCLGGGAVAAALLSIAPPVLAQSAALIGTVKVARTGEPLAGAVVQVEGTRFGGITTAAGTYRIPGIPAGTYTLSARLLGFGRLTHAVTVLDTGTVRADFVLERTATTLDVMVVTGTPMEQSTRQLGNALGKVDVTEVTKVAPPPNVQQLLNNVAGVRVASAGGDVGS